MAFNIVYKRSIRRDLKGIPKAEAGRILDRIEENLVKKPDANPMLKGRFAGLRKLRIGDYRVVYTILGNEVLILRIGHRRDVYKNMVQERRARG